MEKWAQSIAVWFKSNLELDEDKTEVVEYSIISIFLLFFTLLAIILFCWILGVIKEGLIIALTIAILRAATGGAHLASPWRCVIISAVVPAGFGYISHHFAANLPKGIMTIILAVLLVWGFYYIARYAPVESKEKPIRPERRVIYKRLGIGSTMIWAALALFSIYSGANVFFLASAFGFSWQILTLTPFGFRLYDLLSY